MNSYFKGILIIVIITLQSCKAQQTVNHQNFKKEIPANAEKKIKPIVADVGMADPHIYIFNNKAYLYATRDADRAAKEFVMPDWNIWSSSDLVNWKLETTIDPTSTYMGKSNDCWAPDVAFKNEKYYFYFSNKNINTGVMDGKSPIGPFKDALGKPLLPETLTPIKEYDPTILMENDKAKTSYIAFGHYRATDTNYYYMIARLGEDMISLAEAPKKIEISGNAEGLSGNDKPNIHKRNNTYYLSAGTSYAIANNIYGPYIRRGFSGNKNEYGLNNAAHGNYFDWNGQSFHTWCHFFLGKEVGRYRESYINYLHYKDNGDMVDDIDFLDAHGETGVGVYDANWDKIEAEWYMASKKIIKKENYNSKGFSVQNIRNGGYLYFPNVKNIKSKSKLTVRAATKNNGIVEIRKDAPDGPLIATCEIKNTNSWTNYQDFSCDLKNITAQNLYFTFKGDTDLDLFNLDYFKFN